jgi:hypothetical protein
MAEGEITAIVTADIGPFEKKLDEAKKAAIKFTDDISKSLTATVSLSSSKFFEDLEATKTKAKKFQEGAEKSLSAKVSLDVGDFSKKLMDAKKLASKYRVDINKALSPKISVDQKAFRDGLSKAKAQAKNFKDSSNKTLTPKVALDLKAFRKSIADAKKIIATFKTNVNKSLSIKISIDLKALRKGLTEARKIIKTFKTAADKQLRFSLSLKYGNFNKNLDMALKSILEFKKKAGAGLNLKIESSAKGIRESQKELDSAESAFNRFSAAVAPADSSLRAFSLTAQSTSTRLKDVSSAGTETAIGVAKAPPIITQLGMSMREAAAASDRFVQSQEKVKASAQKSSADYERWIKFVKQYNDDLKESLASPESIRKTTAAWADLASLITGPLGGISSRILTVGRALSTGTASLTAFLGSFALLGVSLAKATQEAGNYETAHLRLEGALKATGYAAGVTKEEIIAFADKLGEDTLADPLQVTAAAAKLLTFRGIAKESFFDVIKVSQELADVMEKDLNTTVVQVAAAMQEPVSGISRLREANIFLSEATKDAVKSLFEQGRRLDAQRTLMRAIKSDVEGVSKSQIGYAGAIDLAGQRISEFKRAVVETFEILPAVTAGINLFSGALERAADAVRDMKLNLPKDEFDALQTKLERARENLENVDPDSRIAEMYRKQIEEIEKAIESFDPNYKSYKEAQAKLFELVLRERELIKEIQGGAKGRDLTALKRELTLVQLLKGDQARILKLKKSEVRTDKERAEALSDAAQAEQDAAALAEKERLKKIAEQNRIEQLRDASIRSLKEENAILVELAKLDTRSMSAQEYAQEQERINKLVRLNLLGVETNVELLQQQYEEAKAVKDETRAQALFEQIKNAKAAKALKDILDLNDKLTESKRRQNALDDLSKSDTRALEDANARFAVLALQNDALKSGLMTSKEAEKLARVELEFQKRILELKAKGVKLSTEEQIEERNKIEKQVDIDIKVEGAEEAIGAFEAMSDAIKDLKESDQLELDTLNRQIADANKLAAAVGETDVIKKRINKNSDKAIMLMERINDLQADGAVLSDEELEKQRQIVDTLVERKYELTEIEDQIEKNNDAVQEQIDKQEEAAQKISDVMGDLIFKTRDWKDILADAVIELSKAVIQAQLIELTTGKKDNSSVAGTFLGAIGSFAGAALGNFFAPAAGASASAAVQSISSASSLGSVSAKGPMFTPPILHTGGVVGQTGMKRSVSTSNFINAPRFHNGLRQNEMPAILERGEEVIPKDQVGRRARGDTNITFNVTTPNADSFRLSQRQLSQQAKRQVSI